MTCCSHVARKATGRNSSTLFLVPITGPEPIVSVVHSGRSSTDRRITRSTGHIDADSAL